MIDVAEALRRLTRDVRVLGTDRVELGRAAGRVLAEPVVADRDFPPTDRSAMDGFAVRARDLAESGSTLRIVGEVRAGQPVGALTVGEGQAARILTGAIVPAGADAVVMVERTSESADASTVTVDDAPASGQHIRRRGEELRRGDAVLEPGVPIGAAEIAVLASVGLARVQVFRQPRVSVLATGDEIVEPQSAPADHQVRNSNAHALCEQLRELGVEGRYLGIAGDDRERLAERVGRGLEHDVLLITGGVSVGRYDLVGETLADVGMRLLFHKVRVKPGKPILAGRAGGCLVVGLPGNPVSTFVGFEVFVAPTLRKLLGYRDWRTAEFDAKLAVRFRAKPGRPTFHLARLRTGPGGWMVRPVVSTGSGDVLALSRANALIRTDADGADLPAGATVRVSGIGALRLTASVEAKA